MAQRPRAKIATVANPPPVSTASTAPRAGRGLSRALSQSGTGLIEIEAIADLMATALDAAHASILIADARRADMPLIYVSPAFTRLTGYAAHEALGRNARFLHAPKTDPAAVSAIRAALSAGQRATVTLLNRRKDKSVFWNHLTLVPFGPDSGHPRYWIGVQEDISTQRAAEAAIRQLADDRKALETRLRHTYKMQALGTLSSGIAHDINNLLLAMSGLVEMSIEEQTPGSPVSKRLGSVLSAIDRTSDIVRHILEFSQRGKSPRARLRLDRVLDEGLDLLGASLPATIQLRRRLDFDGTIVANAAELHLILLTLGANAMDAIGHRQGIIDVALERADLRETRRPLPAGLEPAIYARLTFRDNGPGMPPDVAARAFEPLFSTKDPSKGAGMGLAIARGIAVDCGGTLVVDGANGTGAEFTVYLPQAQEA